MNEGDEVRQRTTMLFCWACSCTAMFQQELRQGMALAESEDRKQVADGMDVPQEHAPPRALSRAGRARGNATHRPKRDPQYQRLAYG